MFSRIIVQPLKQLTAMMRAVAPRRAGGRSALEVRSKDGIGELACHFNTAIEVRQHHRDTQHRA